MAEPFPLPEEVFMYQVPAVQVTRTSGLVYRPVRGETVRTYWQGDLQSLYFQAVIATQNIAQDEYVRIVWLGQEVGKLRGLA